MDANEIRKRFKGKMNGLKLNKKIDKEQVQAIMWAMENCPEILDVLYVKKPKLDERKFNEFWSAVPGYAKARSNKKKTMEVYARKQDDHDKIMLGLKEKMQYNARCMQNGHKASELPGMERWLRDDRFLEEMPKASEMGLKLSPGATHCERTAKIFEEREIARENRVTNAAMALDPELRRRLLRSQS